MIPKIFLQNSITPVPNYVREQINYLCDFEYEYVNVTNDQVESFFKEYPHPDFPNIVEKYFIIFSFNRLLATDLFRFYFLYLNGGVTMDDDAMMQVKIKEIAQDYDFFTARSNHSNFALPGFIGASKKNPVILGVLKQLYEASVDCLMNMENNFICQWFYTHFLNHSNDPKYKMYDEMWGFPDDKDGEYRTWDGNKVIMIHYPRRKIIPKVHINIPSDLTLLEK